MENTAKKGFWGTFKEKHPAVAQFIVFFIISNGVTVLQMIMMPAIKYAFGFTSLVNTNFQILPIGHNLDGSVYYVFDYASGADCSGSNQLRRRRRTCIFPCSGDHTFSGAGYQFFPAAERDFQIQCKCSQSGSMVFHCLGIDLCRRSGTAGTV